MNQEGFSKKVVDFLTNLSTQFGSGVVLNDVMVFTFSVGVFALLLALVAWRRSSNLKSPPGLERLAGVSGRVEKVEMNVNELRTEVIRNIEIFKGEFGFLKAELAEIRRSLSRISSGSGGEGGGSGDAGGGSGGFEFPPKIGSGGPSFAPSFSEPIPQFDAGVVKRTLEEPVKPRKVETPSIEEPAENLTSKLAKTRQGFFQKLKNVFVGKPTLAPEMLDELEALLVSSDVGVRMTSSLISKLREEIANVGKSLNESEVYRYIKGEMLSILQRNDNTLTSNYSGEPLHRKIKVRTDVNQDPFVVMVVGVNGVGKTTTVAKLANQCKDAGLKVMLAAADTFRAAAVNQLREWGERIGVPVISGAENAKPSTVVFDAAVASKKEGADVLIIDTAGRLHTKSNLMQELEGVRNAISRHISNAPQETLLVVDGSTGQNALSQAKEFNVAVPLSGIVVTKLDGTSKGGIVVAIKDELGVPIRYIGVGEGKDDLKPFDANEFVEALFETSPTDQENNSQAQLSSHGDLRRRRRESMELSMI